MKNQTITEKIREIEGELSGLELSTVRDILYEVAKKMSEGRGGEIEFYNVDKTIVFENGRIVGENSVGGCIAGISIYRPEKGGLNNGQREPTLDMRVYTGRIEIAYNKEEIQESKVMEYLGEIHAGIKDEKLRLEDENNRITAGHYLTDNTIIP